VTAVVEDDARLLTAMADGDLSALERAYQRYSRGVYSLAVRLLADAPAAEDVVQSAFVELWRQASTGRLANKRLLPWLLGITHNQAVDMMRAGRRPRHPRSAASADACQIDAHVLAGLPAEQRRALELAYYRGMRHDEIAHELGQSQDVIRTRIRSGLQQLLAAPS
jgi:RNA polymerase sigma-70 factor (ECF subfamily)